MEEIRRIESDRRHILEQERNALETDIKTLQQQLSDLTLQFTITREKHALVLQEEQTQHEKAVSALMTEGLSSQANLKAEVTQTLHRLQQDENRRFAEVENQFNRLRDQLVHSHAMEIEQVHDRSRREMQRQKAELEVQFNEQLMKMKHMHEQELNRQIRATDRLQRLVARHGGQQAYPQQDESDFRDQIEEQERQFRANDRNRVGMTSLTPPRGFKPTNSAMRKSESSNRWSTAATDSPPPPPPPLSQERQQQQSQQQKGLNWGPMRSSDSTSNAATRKSPSIISSRHHIPFPAPPDTLPLDEALAATKHTANGGVSISSNVRRVSSYLQALEEYLEGDGNVDSNVNKAVDEVLDVSTNLGKSQGKKKYDVSTSSASSASLHRHVKDLLRSHNNDSDSQSDSLDGLRVNSTTAGTVTTNDSRLGRSLLGGMNLSDV